MSLQDFFKNHNLSFLEINIMPLSYHISTIKQYFIHYI